MINKNNPAYQIGYEQGFKDGVLKERSQNEILNEIRDFDDLIYSPLNQIKSWQKRLKTKAELPSGVEEKEHLSKEMKEDRI